jgi:hypothetical protein
MRVVMARCCPPIGALPRFLYASRMLTLHRVVVGVAVLVVGTVAGCGGDSSSPTAPTAVETATPGATATGTSPYGVCAVTASDAMLPPSLVVGRIPEGDPLYGFFDKCIKVFGVSLLAVDAFADDKLVFVATITAEYLDNNEDGVPDDFASNSALASVYASMILTTNSAEREAIFGRAGRALDYPYARQSQYAPETIPSGSLCGERCGTQRDSVREEVLHLIQDYGYATGRPDLSPHSTSALTKAMDIARDGHFDTVPSTYPASAWYHYNDQSCTYDYQATEYFYWGLTTLLGAQEHPANCAFIDREWELCTKALLQSTDTRLYALLTDPENNLPTSLPDGRYR